MAIDLCHLSGLHIILTFVLAILVCTVSRTVKRKPCSSSNRVFWYFVRAFTRLVGWLESLVLPLSLSLDVQLALIWASKLISSAACGGWRNSLVQMMSRGRIKKIWLQVKKWRVVQKWKLQGILEISLSAVIVFVLSIKGTVHAKIPSTFIHTHVVQNWYDFLLLNTQENTLKNTGVQH